jgi:small subunit ribosomal protein S15
MAMNSEAKAQLIKEYQQSPNDTGSSDVQIALLSRDIELLTQHSKQHAKDKHSKRGLLLKVHKRNRLLRYLKRKDNTRYRTVIQNLGLRDKS